MAAAALLLLVGACQKKKKENAGGPGSAADHQAQAAAPASDELRGMLAMVPVASEAVVGADVAALRKSDLYGSYRKQIESAVGADMDAIRTLCGFDPVEKVEKVVGGGSGGRAHGDATFMIKGLGKADTMGCLTKAAAKPPEGVKVTVDGDYALIERMGEPATRIPGNAPIVPDDQDVDAGAGVLPTAPTDSMSLQFIDDQTVVLARRAGSAVDKAGMQAIIHLDQAASVTGSKGFMEMIDGIDTDAPVWFVINGKTPGGQKLGGGFLKFDAAFGQVYVASGLDVDVTLRLESADAAARMGDVVQRQVDSMRRSILKDALGDVTVEHHDRDMRLTVKESRQQLDKLIEEVGDLLSMMIGG